MRRLRIVVLVLVAAVAGVVGCTRGPSVDLTAEAEKIRARSRQWLVADSTRDVEGAVAMYAQDAIELAANTPAVFGRGAIRTWYESWLPDTTTSLTFATATVDVSSSGDLAYERGIYRFVTNGPKGRSEDEGKYVTIWRKTAGTWEVVLDMANSDLPVPSPGAVTNEVLP